ncbi:MAG: M23 family metallopeptidase [Patescibacteria group bacterium]
MAKRLKKFTPVFSWGVFIIGFSLLNLILINRYSLLESASKGQLGGPISAKALVMEIYSDSIVAVSRAAEENGLIGGTEEFSGENSAALNQNNPLVYEPLNKNIGNYFSPPTYGWNWGVIHDNNAVDIANRCGTPVYAANEGLAVPDEKLGNGDSGFNNGYGIFILIEHPNGTKTRYAHLSKTVVEPGVSVSKGELIAYMGNTGNTHGPSGCHLHFEVLGAENPLAKE